MYSLSWQSDLSEGVQIACMNPQEEKSQLLLPKECFEAKVIENRSRKHYHLVRIISLVTVCFI